MKKAFAVGDRVVVSKPCNCEQTGYYGHVVSVDPGAHDTDAYNLTGACVRVVFQGRINQAAHEYYLGFTGEKPFPCYVFELDHVD